MKTLEQAKLEVKKKEASRVLLMTIMNYLDDKHPKVFLECLDILTKKIDQDAEFIKRHIIKK